MRKYLIVGCGGSGGATLAYMMDQITSEFGRIPSGFKFVHIDVPNAPDTRVPGVGNVFEQGGNYISTAPQSGQYSTLDSALSQQLSDASALDLVATWAPRKPSDIRIPIGDGAGQMRAVGRAITLGRLSNVHEGLSRAVQQLNTVETNSDMTAIAADPRHKDAVGRFDSASRPVTLVVSSMAGGAGASMALDVCRILTAIPGVDPSLIGAFLCTPDVFDTLPPAARGGTRPNALAMLGEIVASQTGAAHAHDVASLRAFGFQTSVDPSPPFARVFPVGRFVGTERTLFGDGSQAAVYRGLGRGLAALISSGTASADFVSFDLGNVSDGAVPKRSHLGWGSSAEATSWGAFGYANFGLGRDRYRYYAAQRLARSAVDHLREGHVQAGNSVSGIEQLRALVDSQWDRISADIGLPQAGVTASFGPADAGAWLTGVAYPRASVDVAAREIADQHLVPTIPQASGTALQWLPTLRNFMFERKPILLSAANEQAYRWSYGWSQGLHERLLGQVAAGIEHFGLPYGREILNRVEAVISGPLDAALGELSTYSTGEIGQVPESFETEVSATRGTIVNGPGIVQRLLELLQGQSATSVYASSAGFARAVLQALVTEVIAPLRASLDESSALLEQAASAAVTGTGLANVQTDQYSSWPSDQEAAVPERFDVADNEILLTPSTGFGGQYESDLRGAVGDHTTFDDARATASRYVISGRWPVAAGASAPGGLVTQLSAWRPAVFNRDPFTGVPLTPSRARYAFALAPKQIVDRSLAFVGRAGESFDTFCCLSLHGYATGSDGAPASELSVRRADIVARFGEALSRALPLASVNSDAVNAIHQSQAMYRYKFSTIPFADVPGLVDELEQSLAAEPNLAIETRDIFRRALKQDTQSRSIDIFGSYRNYSPLVFDSLLMPVAQQWASTPAQGRKAFWEHRRSRPLTASLPMGDEERRAMIGGWYIGQLTGQIRLPESPYITPVEVWDPERAQWIAFPHPMLTPPSAFADGNSLDWLPAVLESSLLAIVRAHEAPVMSSMRPYQLLRALFDDGAEGPATGLTPRSAEGILAAWLAEGTTLSGGPSRVVGDTLTERSVNAVQWLTSIRDFTALNFVDTDTRSNTAGPFARLTTRSDASRTPIFRDLAVDIVQVTNELIGAVKTAERQAQESGSAVARGASGSVVPEPDFGPF